MIICRCGSKYFIESRKASGYFKDMIDGDGSIINTDMVLNNIIKSTVPCETVICAECGHRNKNPNYINGVKQNA